MRLIDADALKEYISDLKYETDDPSVMVGGNQVLKHILPQIIDGAPTIDAKPVRHGKWETTECIPLKSTITMCSACNSSYLTVDIIRASKSGEHMPDYCPSCGARMDGGADE